MSWLAKLTGMFRPPAAPPAPLQRIPSDCVETPDRRLVREVAITLALRDTSLFVPSDDTFNFVAEATRDLDWVKGLDLRRFGDRLSKDEVKAVGARGNAILTRQYMATLTEAGQTDVMASADKLARAICSGIYDAPYLLVDHGKPLQIRLSNGASGPCEAVATYDGVTLDRSAAPRLPLRDCSHPDQCFCRYEFYRPPTEPLTDEERAEVAELLHKFGLSIVIRVGPTTDL